MRKLFDTIYYNTYLFYEKISFGLPGSYTYTDRLISCIFAIPFIIFFLIILLSFFSILLDPLLCVLLFLPITFIPSAYYDKEGKIPSIFKNKPYICNPTFSKLITFLYVFVGLLIFIGGIWSISRILDWKIEKGMTVNIVNISLKRGVTLDNYTKKNNSPFPSLEETEQWLEEKNKSSTE